MASPLSMLRSWRPEDEQAVVDLFYHRASSSRPNGRSSWENLHQQQKNQHEEGGGTRKDAAAGDGECQEFGLALQLHEASALCDLWCAGQLCDVTLQLDCGAKMEAHRVVLAASSAFFRAMFAGAGTHMREAAGAARCRRCSAGAGDQAAPVAAPSLDKLAAEGGLPAGAAAAAGPGAGAGQQQGQGQGQQAQTPLQQGEQAVHLSGIDAGSLRLVLEAVYSGRLTVTPCNVAALLSTASYLQVEAVRQAACQYLRQHLDVSSCLQALQLAAAHDALDLYQYTLDFVRGKFGTLAAEQLHEMEMTMEAEGGEGDGRSGLSFGSSSSCSSLLSGLPLALLMDVLTSEQLEAQSEEEVLRVALAWLDADLGSRGHCAGEVLRAVRLLPSELLRKLNALQSCVSDDCVRVARAAAEQRLESHERQQQAACSSSNTGGGGAGGSAQREGGAACLAGSWCEGVVVPRRSMPTGLMVAGGLDEQWLPIRMVEVYDPQHDRWRAGPPAPSGCPFASGALLGQRAVVVGGAPHSSAVLAYDRAKAGWAACSGRMHAPRVQHAAAGVGDRLVVVGGNNSKARDTADVEWYDPVSDCWTQGSPLNVPRTALGAATLGGCVYVVGGQSGRSCLATCEAMDPGAGGGGGWYTLQASMHTARKYLSVAVLGGRLYAAGGMTPQRTRLSCVEAFDPREGRWQVLEPMGEPRSSFGMAPVAGCLYAVGGTTGEVGHAISSSVERYCPVAGRWARCCPLSTPRSGLALLPL